MMYTITENGNPIGKMNVECLRRWLLKRRSPIQTDITMQNLNVFGRVSMGKVVIRKFVTKGEN